MFHLKRIWRIILSRVFLFLYLCFHNPISISFCLYFLSCLQRFFTKFQFWIQLITGVIPSQFTFSLCFFADSNFPCMSIFFFFLSSSVVFFVSFVSRISCIFQFRINLSMRNIKTVNVIIIIFIIFLILLLKYIYINYFVKKRVIFFIFFYIFPEMNM